MAGSKAQADYWARQLGFGPRDLRYITSSNLIHGVRCIPGYIAGTWWTRPDLDEILAALAPAGIELIFAEEMVPRG